MHYLVFAPAKRRASAVALLLTWPLLSALPPGWAAVTPDNTAAADAPASPNRPTELSLSEGEIQLEGKLHIANPAQSTGLLDVTGFTLPSGKSSHLNQPKGKTIVFNAQTIVHVRGNLYRRLALTALRNTVFAVVIGRDLGSGQSLPAREVAVWDRVVNGVYILSGATPPVDTEHSSVTAPVAPSVTNVPQPLTPLQPALPAQITPPAQPVTATVPLTATTTTAPVATRPATTGATSALTWQNGPILEVQIRTFLRPNNTAALRLPPGTTLPPALAMMSGPSYILHTVFKSPDAAPADATAMLSMPAGLKREPMGPLSFIRPREPAFGRARPMTVQLYWGSGAKILDGQPTLTEAPAITFGYYSRIGRPPESLADVPTVAVGPMRAPGDVPSAPAADAPPPSAVGSYTLTTSFAGNATFQIPADQDFLQPVHINLPADKPDFTQPVTISWDAMPHVVGYRVLATGTRKKTDGPGIVGIMWTSSQVPPTDVTQLQPIDDSAQALKDGRLLPATATSCTIPAGVLTGLPSVSFMVEAFGPVRILPGKPTVRIATSADAVASLRDVNAPDQAIPPRPQPVTPPAN